MKVSKDQYNQIFQYISNRAHGTYIDDETDLFDTKVINSLMLIELMIFIQKKFGIKINSKDMNIKNFSTIRSICEFVSTNICKSNNE